MFQALRLLRFLSINKPIFIFSESRCAIYRIATPSPADKLTSQIRTTTFDFARSSTPVICVLFTRFHVGMPLGMRELINYRMPRNNLLPTLLFPPDSCRPYLDADPLFQVTDYPRSPPLRPPRVFKGFTRRHPPLLLRMRTRSAGTSLQDWSRLICTLPQLRKD